ncbi:putative LRR receptor-like serine/threonine-protein kinase At1g53420 [Curcuma longa]|uniref:putative LRR receptor-like serine/threonine-protein kinase At1g53420 n=1 Tax=Curcuma longa TaxID=136217 RepID=UPI003D9E34A1
MPEAEDEKKLAKYSNKRSLFVRYCCCCCDLVSSDFTKGKGVESRGSTFELFSLFLILPIHAKVFPAFRIDPLSRKKSSSQRHPSFQELAGVEDVKIYSYNELRQATQDFSLANKIGEGGFGYVFKGKLKDGLVVAIKVLSSESKQGVQEFLNELKTIANVVHENLVRIYGCCVEEDYRILVYNYVENNSLAQTLLGRGHSNIQFTWRTRYNICIGVARGLAFLHYEAKPPIVHRDIKGLSERLEGCLDDLEAPIALSPLLLHSYGEEGLVTCPDALSNRNNFFFWSRSEAHQTLRPVLQPRRRSTTLKLPSPFPLFHAHDEEGPVTCPAAGFNRNIFWRRLWETYNVRI